MLFLLWSIKLDENKTLARTSIQRFLKVQCLKIQMFSNLLNFGSKQSIVVYCICLKNVIHQIDSKDE